MRKQLFHNVYRKDDKLYTKGRKLEEWNPHKSKPASAIMNGLRNFPVKKGQKILYLGAAHGTTVSHFSDIVENDGRIYAIEVSGKIIDKLVENVRKKSNVIPLLEDAKFPENYGWIGKVDLVYEDIAQRDQTTILKKNKVFLKKGGLIAIALKAKAIDSIRDVKDIYKEAIKELSEDFEIIETVDLEPYEHDHLFIVGRLKQ